MPQRLAAYLFLPVWIGFILLLDPLNRRLGLPSFLGDLSEGFRRRLYGFSLPGWICGWLWEFWNNWAAAKWHYIFPIAQQWKIFEMPAPGYLGFLPFALECFVDVRYRRLAGRLAQESEMNDTFRIACIRSLLASAALASCCSPAACAACRSRGGPITIPAGSQAGDGPDLWRRSGRRHPDRAPLAARRSPIIPLGYLLEGEALWWKSYCAACEIKYGMVEAWKRSKEPEDDAYLALADKEIDLAEARLAKSETAEMHVYAGMG